MAIRTVVTRGYGNGTFNGTIALVVLRGYIAGAAVTVTIPIKSFISKEADQTHISQEDDQTHISLEADQTKDNPRC